jgi:hypothetical protein
VNQRWQRFGSRLFAVVSSSAKERAIPSAEATLRKELATHHRKRVFVSPQIFGGETWKHGITGKFV